MSECAAQLVFLQEKTGSDQQTPEQEENPHQEEQ